MMRLYASKILKLVTNIKISRKLSQIMSSNKVAVCQMTSVGDKAANLEVVSNLVKSASSDNVQMMFFPEACDFIFDNKKDMLREAESVVDGPTVNRYRKLAKQYNVWLSMGGLHEKDESNPSKVFNTHVIINSKGDIVQTYRKLHLFDVEIPEKNVHLKESDFATPGSHIVTPLTTPIGEVGLAICYDLRFPELSTQLTILGAEILTYPSAFTYATGEAHWEVMLRARAIENQCYVIAAAQVGHHNSKRRSYGHAMCVDPWGKILADCADESPCYKVVEISSEKLREVRRNMPVFQHRRRQVYSLYALSLRKDILPEHSSTTQSPSLSDRESYQGTTYEFGHVRVPETCVFYTSEYSYAFVNLRCVIPGHVLVAPKRAAERNEDLTDVEAADFFKTIRLVQQLMEKVQKAHSCTVTIQDGPDAGQTVKHLHCHVMPRKKGDFIENDLIYLELAKNDRLSTGHPSKPARTLEDMQNEAHVLRLEMETLLKEKGIIS